MTNYKVRAAGNDNVLLFQMKGFPTESFTAGSDLLEYDFCLGVSYLVEFSHTLLLSHVRHLLEADIKSLCDFLLG